MTEDEYRQKETERVNVLDTMNVKTWHDLVRKYIPDATDDFCHYVLWEETSFPVGGIIDIERGIKEFAQMRSSL